MKPDTLENVRMALGILSGRLTMDNSEVMRYFSYRRQSYAPLPDSNEMMAAAEEIIYDAFVEVIEIKQEMTTNHE